MLSVRATQALAEWNDYVAKSMAQWPQRLDYSMELRDRFVRALDKALTGDRIMLYELSVGNIKVERRDASNTNPFTFAVKGERPGNTTNDWNISVIDACRPIHIDLDYRYTSQEWEFLMRLFPGLQITKIPGMQYASYLSSLPPYADVAIRLMSTGGFTKLSRPASSLSLTALKEYREALERYTKKIEGLSPRSLYAPETSPVKLPDLTMTCSTEAYDGFLWCLQMQEVPEQLLWNAFAGEENAGFASYALFRSTMPQDVIHRICNRVSYWGEAAIASMLDGLKNGAGLLIDAEEV